jgi:eukaryotic-like serine/threonine-protein kinase
MGSVWRARHLELDTDVAVKLMDPSLAANADGLARFRREAQAAASLKSPNVVQVYDYGVDGTTPYIAMEMLQGESLAKRIERFRRLPPAATATILLQVARAVGKAHDAGIVHRDLKPENIFLVLDDDVEIAKVLDFGIAKRTGPDSFLTGAVQTQTGAMLGTPYYMSPEQAAGKKDVDHRTDIWSFGVIACECLTGRRMFDADSLGGLVLAICTDPLPPPSQLGPVPPQFDAWFERCVARDRQVRFQSIREAAATLEAVCHMGADGISPYSVGPLLPGAAEAKTSPAEWRFATGSSGSTQAGSTQAGPTSVTVNHLTKTNQKRLLWVGAVGGLLLLALGVFFVSARSTSVAAPANSVLAPALETASLAQDRLPPKSEPPVHAALEPSIAPAAAAVTAAPTAVAAQPAPARNKSAVRATSPKNPSRPQVSVASPAPAPVPAPAPAPAPRNPARPNPVDLAF